MPALTIESCHSTWEFDTERSRYRRVLRGFGEGPAATTEWRPYYGLEIDPASDTFVVVLNADGTRLLRSWRHDADCAQCGGGAAAPETLTRTPAA